MAATARAFILPSCFRCFGQQHLRQQRLLHCNRHCSNSSFQPRHALLPPSSLSTAMSAAVAPVLTSAPALSSLSPSANTSACFGFSRGVFLHGSCTTRAFTTSASSQSSTPPRFTNTDASFDWSDDDADDAQKDPSSAAKKEPSSDDNVKSKLPPPYDPFSKKSAIEEPKDPKDLQEIFHKMRTEGLTNFAVKMFDGLSRDGLTHEALALFAQIKDKATMPDVVAHTAVIEAYANAGGHSKEALKTYERMLASGVNPNAYTYSVLIKGLAKDGKLKDASKYILEMMGKGMKPNVATYTAVFEAHVKEDKADAARVLLQDMRSKGFTPDENAVREHLGKRRHVFRSLMSLLFHK